MAKASDNDFPSLLVTEQASKPTAPAAGKQRLYMKTDHKLYHEDNGGTETEVGGGGSGDVATDTIWDAAGDLAVGTGSNTAARKAIGTAYQQLRVNSAANDLEWAGGMSLLSEIVVSAGGGAATIDFTSIPATGRHLVLNAVLRGAKSAASDNLNASINGVNTGGFYEQQRHYAVKATVYAAEGLAYDYWATIDQPPAASAAAGLFGMYSFIFPYYANTNINKIGRLTLSSLTARATTGLNVGDVALFCAKTDAISQITLWFAGGNVAQNSIASLYIVS